MISSVTAACSLRDSWSHTSRLPWLSMCGPPGNRDSLEDCNQLLNGLQCQDRGLLARPCVEVRTGNWNESVQPRKDLDLAVPDVARQTGNAC